MSFSQRAGVAALTLAAALAITSSAVAAPAAKWNQKAPATRILRYTEADLRTVAGARSLAFRIRQAATDVCGGENVLLRTGQAFYRCTNATIERAMADLDAPRVREAMGRPTDEVARR